MRLRCFGCANRFAPGDFTITLERMQTHQHDCLRSVRERQSYVTTELTSPQRCRPFAKAGERSQVIVVTHATRLITALSEQQGCHSVVLEKTFGETSIVGTKELGAPACPWPPR